jgi:hypothetical protein
MKKLLLLTTAISSLTLSDSHAMSAMRGFGMKVASLVGASWMATKASKAYADTATPQSNWFSWCEADRESESNLAAFAETGTCRGCLIVATCIKLAQITMQLSRKGKPIDLTGSIILSTDNLSEEEKKESSSRIHTINLSRAKLDGASIAGDFAYARFDGASLNNTKFYNTPHEAGFEGATGTNVTIPNYNARWIGSKYYSHEYAGADISGIESSTGRPFSSKDIASKSWYQSAWDYCFGK